MSEVDKIIERLADKITESVMGVFEQALAEKDKRIEELKEHNSAQAVRKAKLHEEIERLKETEQQAWDAYNEIWKQCERLKEEGTEYYNTVCEQVNEIERLKKETEKIMLRHEKESVNWMRELQTLRARLEDSQKEVDEVDRLGEHALKTYREQCERYKVALEFIEEGEMTAKQMQDVATEALQESQD
jgi:hypothetical protein